jgi:outer membrane protein OmpA-like peptidoglycan-associated protein
MTLRNLMVVCTLVVFATGCATKKYVNEKTGEVGTRVDQVEGQVEEAQTRLRDHDERITTASKTAQDALDRAIAAGKLAEGKLVFEQVLTDDKVRFGFNKAELSNGGQQALDAFAEQLKSENKNVYLEIQGHTDAIGSEDYNHQLGEERAESVRRYLSAKHSLPLHRMNVISYGESEPVADNRSREGRAQNRRVVLVVLM